MTASDFVECDDYDCRLRCPHCGQTYLHHGTVEVFTRQPKEGFPVCIDPFGGYEDGVTKATTIEFSGEIKEGRPKDNPSERRNGLAIHFSCECCPEGDAMKLELYQQKGVTYLRWQ